MSHKMAYTINHQHLHDEAESKVRLEALALDLEKQYASQVGSYNSQWVSETQFDFQIKYMGANVTGNISLQNQLVTVEYNLPLLLRWGRKELDKRIKQTLEDSFQ